MLFPISKTRYLFYCYFFIQLFDYERLVNILLHSVHGWVESFVQRIGIYLLNSLACQVDGQQKMKLGELGVIEKMIWLIKERLDQGICDDVLEVAWSTMWNVTDETPLNCKKFLENKGMKYFLACLNVSEILIGVLYLFFMILFLSSCFNHWNSIKDHR